MRSKPIRIVLIIVAIIIVAVLALPFIISGDQFRPKLESELSQRLNRPVHIGSLRLSIFSGGLAATDLAIAEDPAFGKDPFLRAKGLNVGVDLGALIFSHQVNVRSLVIEQPAVNLVQSGSRWNVSSLGQKSAKSSQPSSQPEFTIGKLRIEDGRVTIRDARGNERPTVYEKVNFKATDLSLTKAFPFTLSAVAPSGGKFSSDGTAGPLNATTPQPPITAKFKVDSLDLAHTGFTDANSGIAGTVSANGDLKSDGRVARVNVKGEADRLQLVKGGAPAKVPVKLEAAADYNLQRQVANVTRGVVNIGSAAPRLTGTYDGSGRTGLVDMHLQGRDMSVNDLQAVLPALGIMLPAGSSLQGGTANADLALTGPVDRLVTAGTVNLQNAKLAGFGLASKLAAVSKLTGSATSQTDTMIQMLSSNLRIAPDGIRADNLNLVVPSLGTCTGSGTISPSNQLNFKMVAQLDSNASLVGAVTQIAGLGQRQATLPFSIQGTTSNPVIIPDVAALAGSSLTQRLGQQNVTQSPTANPVGDILGGLFGKKKK